MSSRPLRSTRRCNTSELEHCLLTGVHRLEERRKAKGAAYYERKKAARRQLSEAQKNTKANEKTTKALEAYGF